MTLTLNDHPVQTIRVLHAPAFRAVDGPNAGTALGDAGQPVPGDTYALDADAAPARLTYAALPGGDLRIVEQSETGAPGALLSLVATLSLLSFDGKTVRALLLCTSTGTDRAFHILALDDLPAQTGHTLVAVDRQSAQRHFAHVPCVSFAHGTRITMATGAQTPIEKLRVGARVLTRDHGPQTVLWIGHHRMLATGDLAPIVIKAGTLNNEGDLVVGPNHRIFVSRDDSRHRAGRPDLLIKARHLVNGDTIHVREGGPLDYCQLLFDRHPVVYAEAIAAEAQIFGPRARPTLPAELLDRVTPLLPAEDRDGLHMPDIQAALLNRPDVIDLLRQASMR